MKEMSITRPDVANESNPSKGYIEINCNHTAYSVPNDNSALIPLPVEELNKMNDLEEDNSPKEPPAEVQKTGCDIPTQTERGLSSTYISQVKACEVYASGLIGKHSNKTGDSGEVIITSGLQEIMPRMAEQNSQFTSLKQRLNSPHLELSSWSADPPVRLQDVNKPSNDYVSEFTRFLSERNKANKKSKQVSRTASPEEVPGVTICDASVDKIQESEPRECSSPSLGSIGAVLPLSTEETCRTLTQDINNRLARNLSYDGPSDLTVSSEATTDKCTTSPDASHSQENPIARALGLVHISDVRVPSPQTQNKVNFSAAFSVGGGPCPTDSTGGSQVYSESPTSTRFPYSSPRLEGRAHRKQRGGRQGRGRGFTKQTGHHHHLTVTSPPCGISHQLVSAESISNETSVSLNKIQEIRLGTGGGTSDKMKQGPMMMKFSLPRSYRSRGRGRGRGQMKNIISSIGVCDVIPTAPNLSSSSKSCSDHLKDSTNIIQKTNVSTVRLKGGSQHSDIELSSDGALERTPAVMKKSALLSDSSTLKAIISRPPLTARRVIKPCQLNTISSILAHRERMALTDVSPVHFQDFETIQGLGANLSNGSPVSIEVSSPDNFLVQTVLPNQFPLSEQNNVNAQYQDYSVQASQNIAEVESNTPSKAIPQLADFLRQRLNSTPKGLTCDAPMVIDLTTGDLNEQPSQSQENSQVQESPSGSLVQGGNGLIKHRPVPITLPRNMYCPKPQAISCRKLSASESAPTVVSLLNNKTLPLTANPSPQASRNATVSPSVTNTNVSLISKTASQERSTKDMGVQAPPVAHQCPSRHTLRLTHMMTPPPAHKKPSKKDIYIEPAPPGSTPLHEMPSSNVPPVDSSLDRIATPRSDMSLKESYAQFNINCNPRVSTVNVQTTVNVVGCEDRTNSPVASTSRAVEVREDLPQSNKGDLTQTVQTIEPIHCQSGVIVDSEEQIESDIDVPREPDTGPFIPKVPKISRIFGDHHHPSCAYYSSICPETKTPEHGESNDTAGDKCIDLTTEDKQQMEDASPVIQQILSPVVQQTLGLSHVVQQTISPVAQQSSSPIVRVSASERSEASPAPTSAASENDTPSGCEYTPTTAGSTTLTTADNIPVYVSEYNAGSYSDNLTSTDSYASPGGRESPKPLAGPDIDIKPEIDHTDTEPSKESNVKDDSQTATENKTMIKKRKRKRRFTFAKSHPSKKEKDPTKPKRKYRRRSTQDTTSSTESSGRPKRLASQVSQNSGECNCFLCKEEPKRKKLSPKPKTPNSSDMMKRKRTSGKSEECAEIKSTLKRERNTEYKKKESKTPNPCKDKEEYTAPAFKQLKRRRAVVVAERLSNAPGSLKSGTLPEKIHGSKEQHPVEQKETGENICSNHDAAEKDLKHEPENVVTNLMASSQSKILEEAANKNEMQEGNSTEIVANQLLLSNASAGSDAVSTCTTNVYSEESIKEENESEGNLHLTNNKELSDEKTGEAVFGPENSVMVENQSNVKESPNVLDSLGKLEPPDDPNSVVDAKTDKESNENILSMDLGKETANLRFGITEKEDLNLKEINSDSDMQVNVPNQGNGTEDTNTESTMNVNNHSNPIEVLEQKISLNEDLAKNEQSKSKSNGEEETCAESTKSIINMPVIVKEETLHLEEEDSDSGKRRNSAITLSDELHDTMKQQGEDTKYNISEVHTNLSQKINDETNQAASSDTNNPEEIEAKPFHDNSGVCSTQVGIEDTAVKESSEEVAGGSNSDNQTTCADKEDKEVIITEEDQVTDRQVTEDNSALEVQVSKYEETEPEDSHGLDVEGPRDTLTLGEVRTQANSMVKKRKQNKPQIKMILEFITSDSEDSGTNDDSRKETDDVKTDQTDSDKNSHEDKINTHVDVPSETVDDATSGNGNDKIELKEQIAAQDMEHMSNSGVYNVQKESHLNDISDSKEPHSTCIQSVEDQPMVDPNIVDVQPKADDASLVQSSSLENSADVQEVSDYKPTDFSSEDTADCMENDQNLTEIIPEQANSTPNITSGGNTTGNILVSQTESAIEHSTDETSEEVTCGSSGSKQSVEECFGTDIPETNQEVDSNHLTNEEVKLDQQSSGEPETTPDKCITSVDSMEIQEEIVIQSDLSSSASMAIATKEPEIPDDVLSKKSDEKAASEKDRANQGIDNPTDISSPANELQESDNLTDAAGIFNAVPNTVQEAETAPDSRHQIQKEPIQNTEQQEEIKPESNESENKLRQVKQKKRKRVFYKKKSSSKKRVKKSVQDITVDTESETAGTLSEPSDEKLQVKEYTRVRLCSVMLKRLSNSTINTWVKDRVSESENEKKSTNDESQHQHKPPSKKVDGNALKPDEGLPLRTEDSSKGQNEIDDSKEKGAIEIASKVHEVVTTPTTILKRNKNPVDSEQTDGEVTPVDENIVQEEDLGPRDSKSEETKSTSLDEDVMIVSVELGEASLSNDLSVSKPLGILACTEPLDIDLQIDHRDDHKEDEAKQVGKNIQVKDKDSDESFKLILPVKTYGGKAPSKRTSEDVPSVEAATEATRSVGKASEDAPVLNFPVPKQRRINTQESILEVLQREVRENVLVAPGLSFSKKDLAKFERKVHNNEKPPARPKSSRNTERSIWGLMNDFTKYS